MKAAWDDASCAGPWPPSLPARLAWDMRRDAPMRAVVAVGDRAASVLLERAVPVVAATQLCVMLEWRYTNHKPQVTLAQQNTQPISRRVDAPLSLSVTHLVCCPPAGPHEQSLALPPAEQPACSMICSKQEVSEPHQTPTEGGITRQSSSESTASWCHTPWPASWRARQAHLLLLLQVLLSELPLLMILTDDGQQCCFIPYLLCNL